MNQQLLALSLELHYCNWYLYQQTVSKTTSLARGNSVSLKCKWESEKRSEWFKSRCQPRCCAKSGRVLSAWLPGRLPAPPPPPLHALSLLVSITFVFCCCFSFLFCFPLPSSSPSQGSCYNSESILIFSENTEPHTLAGTHISTQNHTEEGISWESDVSQLLGFRVNIYRLAAVEKKGKKSSAAHKDGNFPKSFEFFFFSSKLFPSHL